MNSCDALAIKKAVGFLQKRGIDPETMTITKYTYDHYDIDIGRKGCPLWCRIEVKGRYCKSDKYKDMMCDACKYDSVKGKLSSGILHGAYLISYYYPDDVIAFGDFQAADRGWANANAVSTDFRTGQKLEDPTKIHKQVHYVPCMCKVPYSEIDTVQELPVDQIGPGVLEWQLNYKEDEEDDIPPAGSGDDYDTWRRTRQNAPECAGGVRA